MKQTADGFRPGTRRVAKLGEARFQRLENSIENMLVVRVDQTTECRKSVSHIRHIEVGTFRQPSRIKIFVSNEIPDVSLNELDRVSILFADRRHVGIFDALLIQPRFFLFGKKLIEDEAENVILVFACLDLGTHFVG